MKLLHHQHGVTFIELIITILVIGIAVTGILQVITINTGSSADPLIQHQAIAIAEAYLEEIVEKPFADPGGPIEMGRADFDDINDYAVIAGQVPQDQNGTPIPGLENYLVSVTVINEAVGPAGNQAPAPNAFRITVAVTTPTASVIQMSAYRTNYF